MAEKPGTPPPESDPLFAPQMSKLEEEDRILNAIVVDGADGDDEEAGAGKPGEKKGKDEAQDDGTKPAKRLPPGSNDDDDETGDEAEDDGGGEEEDTDLENVLDEVFSGESGDDAYDTGVAKLKAGGLSDAAIKKIPREDVLKVGAKSAKSAKDGEADSGESRTARGGSPVDAAIKRLAKVLGGDDAAREEAQEIIESIHAPQEHQNKVLLGKLTRFEVEQAASRLVAKYPQLGQAANFKIVVEKALVRHRSGLAKSIGAAMRDESAVLFGERIAVDAAVSDRAERELRGRGKPSKGGRRTPEPKLSRDTATDAFLDARLSGNARRASRFITAMNGRR